MKKCIRCGSTNTIIYDSRLEGEEGLVARRRKCLDCGCKYKTIEVDYYKWLNLMEKEDN